ncbi:MAG: tetratricopeptide repeat protein [Chthoniobacter sp.]
MSAPTLGPTTDSIPPRPRLPESRVVAYVVLGLIAAVVCSYALIVRADFIDYDDNSHVFENPLVKGGLSWHGFAEAFTQFHASLWVPLTWLSFMTDVSLFGMNPGAMHAVNLAWHTASTVLLFFTLRRMTRHLWASAFVAALFGLHPLNVESVAWITERKNVLNAFFWFAALAAYAHYAERPRPLPYLAALGGAALALLAKPMAVTLPCTLLLLDFWPLQRWRTAGWPRLFLEKLPFFLLSAGSCWMTMHAPRERAVVTTEMLSLAGRVSNALISYVVYLGTLAVPIHLGVIYPHPVNPQPILAAGAALLLVVITALAGRAWKTQPYLLMGWLWFLGTLVPVIGLVQVGSQARADRFTYVPQIGIFLAVTWLVKEHWPKNACALRFVAGPVLLASALLTSWQVTYWLDGATLFEHTIAVTKNNATASGEAGMHRARQGDAIKAIAHFQASLRLLPDQPMIWREFGATLLRVDKPQDAVQAFRMALRYDPADFGARYKLAVTLEKGGATDEAIAQFEQILENLPKSAGSHYYLARALEQKGQHEAALAHLREAARLSPGQPTIATALRQVVGGAGGVAAYPEF